MNKMYMRNINKSRKKPTKAERDKAFKEILDSMTPEQLKEMLILYQDVFEIPPEEMAEKIKEKKMMTAYYIKQVICPSVNLKKLLQSWNCNERSYYKYIKQFKDGLIDKRKRRDWNELLNLIKRIYEENKRVYGVRKIWAVLNEMGYKISKKTVHKGMKLLKIKSVIRRKAKYQKEPKNTRFQCPNLLKREFKNRENEFVCMDITYVPWNGINYYLCAAINLLNNEIIGWTFSDNQENSIVLNTLKQIEKSDIVVHTDHGTQFSSHEVIRYIKEHDWKQSMSRVGNALDNRPIEYWFSIFKSECLSQLNPETVITFNDLKREIENFIFWYDHLRIQLVLKNCSPINFGKQN